MTFISSGVKFGMSTNTTRKIDTLRRMAMRLKVGSPLKDGSYLEDIADEMERVYGLMLERNKMGVKGQDTGLKDSLGNTIHVGDTLVFDPKEWGNDESNVFVVEWEDGQLTGNGALSDWSQWCTVIDYSELKRREKEIADLEASIEADQLKLAKLKARIS